MGPEYTGQKKSWPQEKRVAGAQKIFYEIFHKVIVIEAPLLQDWKTVREDQRTSVHSGKENEDKKLEARVRR